MGVVLSNKQTAILAGDLTPKFLATVSRVGEPNVVPVLSLSPLEPGVACFAEFMIWKTKANLTETGRAAILALDLKLNYFAAHGAFRGFVHSGPVFDLMAGHPMFRYNPYNGIRSAGTIELDAVDVAGQLPALGVLAAHLRAGRLAKAAAGQSGRAYGGTAGLARASAPGTRGTGPMPTRVAEKFGRLKALKAVAWPVNDSGGCGAGGGGNALAGSHQGVRVLPAAGVAPAGRVGLVIADRAVAASVPDGSRVAVAVITMDPVAYQVKGLARRWRGVLLVEVTEAYSASPPVPGKLCGQSYSLPASPYPHSTCTAR